MCFVAGALGLTGLAGNLFNASLALSAVTQVAGAAARFGRQQCQRIGQV